MNKKDLIAKMARDVGLSKVTAEAALESVLHGIVLTLKRGDSVTLTGFGSFKPGDQVTFTAGKALKSGRLR